MGKVIVITGGSGGLGKKLRELFTARGDTVCSLSRSNPDGYAQHFFCDVSQEDSVKSALESAMQRHKRIDVLIVNSGIGIAGATELLDSGKVKEVMDINFFGAFYTVKHSLKYMDKGARIVNISSVCAFFPLPFRTVYCASKAALSLFSLSLDMELKARGITSTAVCPGEIRTGFSKNRIKSLSTNEFYGEKIADSLKEIERKEPKRMTVDYAAKRIFKIIEGRKIKPFYIIGRKYKVFYFFSKILPSNLFYRITAKLYS